MTIHILDTNRNTTKALANLKAAGIDKVIRYISVGGGDKVIGDAEARAMAATGVDLVLVYEVSGRPRGTAIGIRDGDYAKKRAQQLGAPAGTIIWYTDDEDASDAAFVPTRDAFVAFRDAIKPYRCGGYGSGWLLDKLYDAGIIVARWLTDSRDFRGTPESTKAGRYELIQALPHNVAGLDTDADAEHIGVDGKAPDIGAFVPFATLPVAKPVVDHPPSALPADHPPAKPTPVPQPAPRPTPSPAPSAHDQQDGGDR